MINVGGNAGDIRRNDLIANLLIGQSQQANNGTFLGALSAGLAGALGGAAMGRGERLRSEKSKALAQALAGGDSSRAQQLAQLSPNLLENVYADRLINNKERRIIKSADGLNRYVDTGEPVFSGVQPKPSNELESLLQGLPIQQQQKIRMQRLNKLTTHAPATQINMAGEREEQKKLGQGRGERANELFQSRDDALDKIPRLETLKELSGGLQTDLLTPQKASAARFLNAIGADPNKLGLPDISTVEQFQSISGRFLMDELAKQKGPQTEGDAQRMQRTLASLSNTPKANEFIVNMAIAIERSKIEKADFYEDYMADNGTLSGVSRAWRESPKYNQSVFDYLDLPEAPPGVSPDEWKEFLRIN